MKQQFNNKQLFDLEIPDYEDLELIPVSQQYFKIIVLNNILFSLLMLLGFLVAYIFFRHNFSWFLVWITFTIMVLLVVFFFLSAVIGFKYRKYAVRENDLVYQHGWLKRTLIIIPFNRIQHIKIEQGWLSKILKLKSISVYTAGVDTGDISVNGLPEEIAEGINNLILKNIKVENEADGAGA